MITLEKDFQIQYYTALFQEYLIQYKIYICVLCGILFISFICFWYSRKKYHNRIQSFVGEERVQRIGMSENIEKLQVDLWNKEHEITDLQVLLSEAEQDKGRIYSLSVQLTELRKERKSFFIRLILESDTYRFLLLFIQRKRASSKNKEELKDDNWKNLMADIDHYSNDFTERLKSKYVLLNAGDVRICCLCKIGLSYSDIAIVMGRTLDAMYKRRNSILGKMNLHFPSQSLEEILDDF